MRKMRAAKCSVYIKRVLVAMSAHVRQCDASLSFDWNDDPPQKVRALARPVAQCSFDPSPVNPSNCSILALALLPKP